MALIATKPVTFGLKLYTMVDDAAKYNEVIGWTPCGCAFEVRDVHRFVTEVLPSEGFRTNKYLSFRKQLNNYGFSGDLHEYRHPNFRRGEPLLAAQLSRLSVREVKRMFQVKPLMATLAPRPPKDAFPMDCTAVPPDYVATPPDCTAVPPDYVATPPDCTAVPPDYVAVPPDYAAFSTDHLSRVAIFPTMGHEDFDWVVEPLP